MPEDTEVSPWSLCPECGCIANIEHADYPDGLVCEEYPGCASLMEIPNA